MFFNTSRRLGNWAKGKILKYRPKSCAENRANEETSPQSASPPAFLNSAWSYPCARKLACGTPCFIGLTSRCFAHSARASCAPFGTKGAHEGRRLWRKQAVVVEAPKGWRGEDSAKRFAAPKYRASEAQAGTKTPVRQGKPRVSLRTSEVRRAEVASTRSEAQCAATQHRAAEGEHGAKTRIDYAALWNGDTAQP